MGFAPGCVTIAIFDGARTMVCVLAIQPKHDIVVSVHDEPHGCSSVN